MQTLYRPKTRKDRLTFNAKPFTLTLMNNENTSTENINEEDVEIIDTLPPVRVNDIVKHPTLGEFQVIGSSQQKAICQSSRGAIYSLAMGHLYLKSFCFPHAPNVFVHRPEVGA
jgi:hypothetical protein